MNQLTETDLRATLHEEAARGATGQDPWPELRHHGRRRRAQRRTVRVLALCCMAAAVALATGLTAGGPSPNPHVGSRIPLMRLTSYTQACGAEPNVCAAATAGAIPKALYRPLHLPALAAGAECPTTAVDNATNPYVYGLQFGSSPVSLVIGNTGDAQQGSIVLGTTEVPGWYAMENVFLSLPGYTGPFLVRGARLNGSATVAFGGSSPAATSFVAPPGPGANSSDGYRFPPGSIWVTAPGCYGFQIDGLSFSETVVIDALPSAGGAN